MLWWENSNLSMISFSLYSYTHTLYDRKNVLVAWMLSATLFSMMVGFVFTHFSVLAVWLGWDRDSFAGNWSQVAHLSLIHPMNENWHLWTRPNVSSYSRVCLSNRQIVTWISCFCYSLVQLHQYVCSAHPHQPSLLINRSSKHYQQFQRWGEREKEGRREG